MSTSYLWDQWNIIHVVRLGRRLKALIDSSFSNIFLLQNFLLQVFLFPVRPPPFPCSVSVRKSKHLLADSSHNNLSLVDLTTASAAAAAVTYYLYLCICTVDGTIRPHHMHMVQRRGLLLLVFHGLCVCWTQP